MKKKTVTQPHRAYLAILISALLITPTYVTAIEHSEEVKQLLEKNDVVELTSKDSGYIYKSDINSNNIVHINGASYTGYFQAANGRCLDITCIIENNYVVMDSGNVNNLYGVTDISYSSIVKTNINAKEIISGTVYIYDGTINHVDGVYVSPGIRAQATIDNTDAVANSEVNLSGSVYMYNGVANGGLSGITTNISASAYTDANITANATSKMNATVSGQAYLYNGSVGGFFTGAYVDTYTTSSSKVTGTINVTDLTINSSVETNTKITGLASVNRGHIIDSIAGVYSYTYTHEVNESTKTTSSDYNLLMLSSANAKTSIFGTVYINDGLINGNIYGVSMDIDEADDNINNNIEITASSTVTITGNTKLQTENDGEITYNSEIWGAKFGGNIAYFYDIFSGNTLNMDSSPLTVTKLGNFEYYNFAINDFNNSVINNGNLSLITVTNLLTNNDSGTINVMEPNQSKVKLTGISGAATVSVGDTVNLITLKGAKITQGDTPSSLSELFDLTNSDNTINVGLVGEADVGYSIEGNSVVATIKKITKIISERVNYNVKPLAEGRLAGFSNVVRGGDSLTNIMSIPQTETGTFTPIATLDGGTSKYHSGSHIESRDYRLMVGSRYQIFDNLYAGLVLEYGRSNYDTYNRFTSGNIHGRGHTYNYGASLFSKYSYAFGDDEWYLDAALRFGRTSTEFNSNDIITGAGTYAKYKSKASYIGASLGSGYIYKLNDKYSFDSSLRYFYTRLNADSVIIDGDKVNFENSTSSRVQLKEQFNYQHSEQLTFTLAGIYEYEFDGKAKNNVAGISIDAPSVKGSTSIVELGVKAKPLVNAPNLGVSLAFRGYSGKRDGVNAFAMIKYDF